MQTCFTHAVPTLPGHHWLVVYLPLYKNMQKISVNWDDYSQYIIKKCSKPPTRPRFSSSHFFPLYPPTWLLQPSVFCSQASATIPMLRPRVAAPGGQHVSVEGFQLRRQIDVRFIAWHSGMALRQEKKPTATCGLVEGKIGEVQRQYRGTTW